MVETQPESPSAVPPEPPGAARPARGFVVLTIGLPGSGKTTWFKRRGVTPLSSDLLRTILFDDITEQRYQGLVFSTLRSLAARATDREDAMELRGRDEPVAARTAAVDQDGEELRLRGAGGLLRCAVRGLYGAEPAARAHGERRDDAQNGGAPASAQFQGRLLEDHRGARQGSARADAGERDERAGASRCAGATTPTETMKAKSSRRRIYEMSEAGSIPGLCTSGEAGNEAPAAIEFRDVSYRLPDGRALLEDLSLQVAAGSTVALLGKSGSGKTTLLRAVNRMNSISSGEVLVRGRSVAEQDLIALRRSIGYVIQETGLVSALHGGAQCRAGAGDRGHGRELQSANGHMRCSKWWGCKRRSSPSACRMNYPADSGSGWDWRGRWLRGRTSC